MKLRLIYWLPIVAILFHTSISFCAENLSIVSATPRGELRLSREASQISITFNQPMTALSQDDIQKPSWFQIKPSVAGKYQWVGTTTLSFRPDTLLPNATSYQVTISGTVASVKGNQLGNTYHWTFAAPRPRIRHITPRKNSKSIDIRTQIILQFN